MTIKELRQMKGLTLAAFAKSIGIGMSTLTGYEAGKRQPGEKALAAIKKVYGVDLNDTLSAAQASSVAPAAPVEATPAKEKAVEKKATKKPRAKKQAAPVETAPVEERAEKPAKKPRAKKQPMPVEAAPIAPAEEKAEKSAKKPRAKKQAAPVEKKPAQIIIQSPMGGEITPEEILSRVGDVDKVYVRLDQNAIYWVKGEETGAINIW